MRLLSANYILQFTPEISELSNDPNFEPDMRFV